MNIYQKMQLAKVRLQELNLKKTGQNPHVGYFYFELSDFLPHLTKIMNEIGLTSWVSFTAEMAQLMIVNSENPEESIVCTSPMKEANLRNASEIQNLGAVETYERRYLYQAAFDIAENDALDATQGRPDEKGKTTQSKKQKPTESHPAPTESNVVHICANCGERVTAIQGKSGEMIPAERLAAISMKNYGAVLCAECH